MPIKIYKDKKLISIESKESQYIIGIDSNRLARHIYYGRRISCAEDFEVPTVEEISSNDPVYELSQEEYSPFGGLRYKEPCLKVEYEDGTRDLVLEHMDSYVENDVLYVKLADRIYDLWVTLKYKVFEELDIIERSTEIINKGNQMVKLENVQCGEVTIPYNNDLYISNVGGHWAGEQRRFREALGRGKKVLESRRGNSSHNHNPYFFLDNSAEENWGEVYFGALALTGNFKIVFETTPYDTLRVIAGINDFDFSWILNPGEAFQTPSFYLGYTMEGFNSASHSLHNLANKYIIPLEHREEPAPVLYNSWEATGFAVDCKEQMLLAEKAAELGVELFVVDDGWFVGRDSDASGLGDWLPDRKKFPNGLTPLIEKVNSLGMSFGLWVEPEMINEDSELFRQHKDWIYSFSNRKPSSSRNQLVLNLTKKEVSTYIFNVMDELLSNNNITYIKWDSNRPFSECGALNLCIEDRKSVYFRHMLEFYSIVDRLRRKHSKVWFECCASGGGRIDFGSLAHFDQFWLSDNTDALDRLHMQEAYSMVYPMKAMRAWVTDCPNFISNRTIPLQFRFHSAMMGALGIGGDISKWSSESVEISKKLIKEYKKVRHIVEKGRIYRLCSLDSGLFQAVQYMLDNGEGIILIYSKDQQFGAHRHRIKLMGIEKTPEYRVSCSESILVQGIGCKDDLVKHGDYLSIVGFELLLKGDYSSALLKITKV